MKVFFLPGRCEAEIFVSACSHLSSYSVSQESKLQKPKAEKEFVNHRLNYAPNPTEVDNRLLRVLGALK